MNYNAPNDYQIRRTKNSTIKTLNGYPRQSVGDMLLESLRKGLVIDAQYWAAELLASGFYSHLWDYCLQAYYSDIHGQCPQLVTYLDDKSTIIERIKKTYTGNLPCLCNNQELRNHLAEIITVLCLINKAPLGAIVEEAQSFEPTTQAKADQIIKLLAPNLSPQSLLYRHFQDFIMSYYANGLQNCRFHLEWFVKDHDHTLDKFIDFKVPPTLSNKSMWLVWRFLVRNAKKASNALVDEEGRFSNLMETLLETYLSAYKRKNIAVCTDILTLVTTMIRQPEVIHWSRIPNLNHPQVIKSCAEINNIYRDLQKSLDSHEASAEARPKAKGGRTKASTSAEKAKAKFYANPRNTDFLKAINDMDILLEHQSAPPTKTKTEPGASSDNEEILQISIQPPPKS